LRTTFLSILPLLSLFSVACFKAAPAVTNPPISISISSTSSQLALGQAASITAVVYDQSNQGVTWAVTPANFGALSGETYNAQTLTASATYTAPNYVTGATAITVTATSITNPNISSSISFHYSPITLSLSNTNTGLPAASQTLAPAQQMFLTVDILNDTSGQGVNWSLSPSGVGTVTEQSANGVSYTAPATVSGPTTVSVIATSVADPTVAVNVQFTILPSGAGPNVAMLNVNGGPIPGQVDPNQAFISVTFCNPGVSTTCQTVNGILVDTGSYGLRILQSQIPLLKLPIVTDALGNTLENCNALPDGSFLWGPVSQADVYLGGEGTGLLASGTYFPIQVISSANSIVPEGCSNGGVDNNTAQLLGANGILGIGPEPTDCTLSGVNYCDGSNQSSPPNVYYSCPSTGCSTSSTPTLVPSAQQVANPISSFPQDNNGFIIQLPAVSGPTSSTVGTITFGVGNEPNNGLTNATIFTLDASDNFTTTLDAQTFSNSFIVSGSSAILFSSSMPVCTVYTGYYCPSSTTNFAATNQGATQGEETVDFSVDNGSNLLSANSMDAVFGTLAGPAPTSASCQGNASCTFVWGLPFFYGRTIYATIDGQSVPSGTPNAPWWAY
jgi:Protein of unknown function (DUF3443)